MSDVTNEQVYEAIDFLRLTGKRVAQVGGVGLPAKSYTYLVDGIEISASALVEMAKREADK